MLLIIKSREISELEGDMIVGIRRTGYCSADPARNFRYPSLYIATDVIALSNTVMWRRDTFCQESIMQAVDNSLILTVQ